MILSDHHVKTALQFCFPRGYGLKPQILEFLDFCEQKARWTLSHPQIVTKGKDGSLIDDYRLPGDSWGKGKEGWRCKKKPSPAWKICKPRSSMTFRFLLIYFVSFVPLRIFCQFSLPAVFQLEHTGTTEASLHLAQRQHPGRCPCDGLVGLWLSDCWHRKSHHHCRWQHLDPRASASVQRKRAHDS